MEETQHIRYNPLKGEWLLVSPHRAKRPWSGQIESGGEESVSTSDDNNYLCPGATRSSGIINPNYRDIYTFLNDFPALQEDNGDGSDEISTDVGVEDCLFISRPARGVCKVMCYHPKPNIHLGTMTSQDIRKVIDEWKKETNELGLKYSWVQIFENRGSIMGCSNPHPHCQIWASNFIPNEPRIKNKYLLEYYNKNKRQLLRDYTDKELRRKERIVYENSGWVVLVPYWAVWPFETMVLPKQQFERFTDLNDEYSDLLGDALQCIVAKYDNLFKCNFSYSMGFHGAPTGNYMKESQAHWTFHAMFLPPLLRSATIKKFMVGYELLAQAQRDLTPEKAADLLRQQESIHYKIKTH